MRPSPIVVADPRTDAGLGFAAGFESIEIDAFVFERPPQPFDEHVVHPAALAIHRDADAVALQHIGEGKAGELRTLIGVEDLRHAVAGDRLFEKSASIVFDSRQARTLRLAQSITATR